MANTKILDIAGSLRKASFNRMALNAAQGLVPVGAALEILYLPDLPGFNQDNEKSPPAAVTDMKAKIRAADAILLVAPEYNYSIPAYSRTRSIGPRGPTATALGRASRRRSWAPPPVRSAPPGRNTTYASASCSSTCPS